jgi:hypothetical protein
MLRCSLAAGGVAEILVHMTQHAGARVAEVTVNVKKFAGALASDLLGSNIQLVEPAAPAEQRMRLIAHLIVDSRLAARTTPVVAVAGAVESAHIAQPVLAAALVLAVGMILGVVHNAQPVLVAALVLAVGMILGAVHKNAAAVEGKHKIQNALAIDALLIQQLPNQICHPGVISVVSTTAFAYP